MASRKNNNLSNIKMQAANEVGVPLKDNGYNGDLTSRQAGSVGGQMVNMMCPKQRMRNQYYIPGEKSLGIRFCGFSHHEKRMLRRNISIELGYSVEVLV